ncbi:transglutaminase domain-containing protein [Microbulbifer salipaludis]|uniref:Transglutaminase domain-containing protein n=1 Tax=Microbulbifer salipaludis TaxID=187980 RepID=A0ABS3E9P7_9GAMM|nr:transglutaminase domain-containing protein [Microbulbifer salipaludis]MBN8432025.1 transglutaminase domain-containing protein [Microbulbifer salipaludis]
MLWKFIALLPLIPVVLAASSRLSADTRNDAQYLTLVAEITIENGTAEPIEGYVHRVAVPVEGHMQQRLLGIRHDDVQRFLRKPFKHSAGDYVELEWTIPARSTSTKKIYFDLLVQDYQLHASTQQLDRRPRQPRPHDVYTRPAKYIESEADEIVRLARHIERSYADAEARLRAAFLTPQQMIQYRRQSTRGALYAVSARQGDCTEYAALFVAIARAMGYPARMTSEFLFTEHREFSQPNHHAAEVYLEGRWIPVDANLALDPRFGYGFGVGSHSKIVLNRNSVWVWSNLFPRGVSKRRGEVDVDMQWRILEMQGAE